MENHEKQDNVVIYKKRWLWITILVILISIGFCIYIIVNNNSTFNNYKNQAVSILNDYKKGKTTRKETKDRIESISDKLSIEKANDDTTEMLILSTNLQRIEWDLVNGELSDTEVINYIKEIKEIK